jgi:hypothetical protein
LTKFSGERKDAFMSPYARWARTFFFWSRSALPVTPIPATCLSPSSPRDDSVEQKNPKIFSEIAKKVLKSHESALR